jgi:hypothetical protein
VAEKNGLFRAGNGIHPGKAGAFPGCWAQFNEDERAASRKP